MTTTEAPSAGGARAAYALNAAVAAGGVLLTLAVSVAGGYEGGPPPEPGVYGLRHPDGLAGAWSRGADTLSYFTIWSNAVVAIALGLLAWRPSRSGPVVRVLRLDSVLMITITALVYAVLLAPTDVVTGWSRLTNPWLHMLTPALTVLVWLAYGPRGWITRRTLVAALTIPVAWIVWMLVRGTVIGAYPYAFLNVAEHGYAAVLATLAQILVLGLAIGAAYGGLDALLRRRAPARVPAP